MEEEEPLNLIPNGTLKLDTKSIRTGMLEWKNARGPVQRSRRSLRVVCELMMDTVWVQKKKYFIKLTVENLDYIWDNTNWSGVNKYKTCPVVAAFVLSSDRQYKFNLREFCLLLRLAYTSVLLDCRRQGTVLLTQVPVTGSTDSTMTKGRSSRVATVRCL